jgi:general secretion pathway protein J
VIPRPHSVKGFTLIEALVALAILAVIALLAYRATAAMSDSEAHLADESSRWRRLDLFFTRLEADLREAVPRGVRHGGGYEAAWSAAPADNAGNTELTFTRAGSEFAIEPGIAGQRIGYRLRNGAVEIVYWPALDNPASAVPTAYPLIDGVAGFRVSALTANGAWSAVWPAFGQADVPRATHVEVMLSDGTRVDRVFALQ